MNKYYYVDKNKDRKGPYSIDELMTFSIDKNTLVYCKGMTTWTKAGTVDELKDLFTNIEDPYKSAVADPNTLASIIGGLQAHAQAIETNNNRRSEHSVNVKNEISYEPEIQYQYESSTGPSIFRYLLCFIIPPIAVYDKGIFSIIGVLILTFFGWWPGIIAAILILRRKKN